MGDRIVLKWDPYHEPTASGMELRLTYEGLLLATQGDPRNGQPDARATHKHEIRRSFHRQLKHFWATHKWLKNAQTDYPDEGRISLSESIARRYVEYGYRFVPLVREKDNLLCSVSVLFLRREAPGGVIKSGDIDNRVKTLFDALRRPRNGYELIGNEKPQADEDPFFVLLEDDSLISHAVIETDVLLDPPPPGDADVSKARLIITVNIRPYIVGLFNLSFS